MLFVRLLLPIFANVLFAAHIMRFYGLLFAVLVLLLNFTFLIRQEWVLKMWQILLAMAVIVWIYVSFGFIQYRMIMDAPWVRLTAIMSAIVLYNIIAIIWMNSKKLKSQYIKNND